jgi:hypothetical protein
MKSRTASNTDGGIDGDIDGGTGGRTGGDAFGGTATRLASSLHKAFPDLCLAIASDELVPLQKQLERIHGSFVYMHHVDDAIAFAAGNAMVGKRSMVVLRADRLDECADTVDQLVKPFRLPIGLVVAGSDDADGQRSARLGLTARSLDDGDTEDVLRWFENTVGEQEIPAVLCVPSRSLGPADE